MRLFSAMILMTEARHTVLITGASSGIGKATAKYFSDKGWNVAATMRTPERDDEVRRYRNTRVYTVDVTLPESIDAAIALAVRDFGRIDAVVNNAGYGVDGVFEAMSDDVIRRQFETNVFGLMRVTRSFIAYFRTNRIPGHIIQVSSMGGRLAFPLYSIYHGTKWAVEGFSESLHYELAPFGIRVKIVEPGPIRTEFYGRNREFIRPHDAPAYDDFVDRCDKVAMATAHRAVGPESVARTIFRAANSTSGRLRYPAGQPGPLILALRRMLPDRVFFSLVRLSYRIR
jgi:NAD(P)-dependent dehydrogenase (short-subunit alcohol dehydrogenase family)